MIYYIVLFIFLASIIGTIITNALNSDCDFIFFVLLFVSIILFICMSFVLFMTYVSIDANKAVYEETYNILIYKAQTEEIRDEFGILNKEYIDEIQNWNTDLIEKQKLSQNFWIGIFYPDWYNDFELIDLDNIKIKE